MFLDKKTCLKVFFVILSHHNVQSSKELDMSKWDDYSISEEEWKYLKKVTGEDIDNYNGYRMEVFLLTNKGILETYRNPKKLKPLLKTKRIFRLKTAKKIKLKKAWKSLKKSLK